MAKRGVRAKRGEDLSDFAVSKVISLLEVKKTISKKEACKMLNIAYNTTRLANIMGEYKHKVAFVKAQRKALAGVPVSETDVLYILQEYLAGESLSTIADATFRSTSIIKRVLNKYSIPLRDSSDTYDNPPLLPLNSIKEHYNKNDLVYSARYSAPAYIRRLVEDGPNGKVYSIWLLGAHSKNACQPYYELSSLVEVQNLGIKIPEMDGNDIRNAVNQAVINANKRRKE